MMNRDEKMVVGLMGCSHALSHGYLLIYPAVLLLLQKEFSMDYLKLGVVGNIMNFCYGLGALPGGLIYNALGPKKLFFICFLGSSLAAAFVSLSPTVTLFAAGLALLGVLGSVYHPLGNAVISAKVREYGRALGIHGAVGNIGLSLAPFMIGLIASRWGWRQAYLIIAVPGIVLSAGSLFVDLSPKREKGHSPSVPSKASLLTNLKVYFTPSLVCLYLINVMINFSFVGSITFLPTCLAKRTSFHLLSLDHVAIGGMLSAVVLFMGVFGQFAGGILAQKPHLERNLLLVNILAFPFILAMSFTTNLPLLFLGLIFFFLNFFLQPMANTLLARYTTVPMRGAAFGIFFTVAFCLASSASSFSGYIAQEFGLQWVFMGLGSSGLLLSLFAFFLTKIQKGNPLPR